MEPAAEPSASPSPVKASAASPAHSPASSLTASPRSDEEKEKHPLEPVAVCGEAGGPAAENPVGTAGTDELPGVERASTASAPAEPAREQAQQSAESKKPPRSVLEEQGRSSSSGDLPVASRPFVPLAPRSWRGRVMHSNTKLTRLVKAALLQTLLHALRVGSVEGVKVAIERGVQLQYVDARQRNLLMLAARCDTDARLEISIILADAGVGIDHRDQLGWSCLHYACAAGALDVATELIRRGAKVEFNPYGYGPEDFIIPKVSRAKSLLQHTEQLQHEQKVRACWDFFRKNAEQTGYGVKCKAHCDLGKPLKVTFQAPAGHSTLDRIRVVDVNADVALWLQVSKTFAIPPGEVGTITLDSETLDRPSLYRVFYEKYEPTPVAIPPEVAEKSLCVKNLDTGTTEAVGAVNDLVLRQLATTRSSKTAKHLSASSREAPKSEKAEPAARGLASTTRFREKREASHESADEEEDSGDFSSDETITAADIAEHPAVHSITGVYQTAAMAIVSVSTLKSAKANEYEVVIKRDGPIGLSLEPRADASSSKKKPLRSTHLIVRRSQGQAAAVNPGDCLVAIGSANIEHAGLKHTLWALNEARRPLVLRFRRGNATAKKSLFAAGLSKLSGPRRQAAIAV